MTSLSLRKKFILGTTLLIMLIGCALAMLVKYELHSRFEDEVLKRGLSVARYIAEAAEIPLITENKLSLELLVNDYRKLDKDIEYIYIVAPDKSLTVHTFGTSIPKLLINEALEAPRNASGTVTIETKDDMIYDISTPIQGGTLGYVHIGLYGKLIHKNIDGVLLRMLPFVLGILIFGTILAVLFASAITRPIALLTSGVKRLSKGEITDPIIINSHDEIGLLAEVFNQMTANIRESTVSREFMEKLINTMNEVLVVISPEGFVMNVNRAYFEVFGGAQAGIIERHVNELDQTGAPAKMYAAYEQSLEDCLSQGIEISCKSATGEQTPLLLSLAVMRDEDGAPQAIICAAQNISNIKMIQEALHQKQAELEEVNRNLEDIVASRTAELAIGNEGLRAEVAERQRKTEELRAARDVAESANRAKSEFLANMSHEMRTPLNSIIGGTEYLDSAELNEDQHRCATMIRHAGDSLLTLVNDLIDLSRIEAGQLEITSRPFNLQQTLEQVIEMIERGTYHKSVKLSLISEPSMPQMVKGDQIRLQQVLVNLVANAVKFTEIGGAVSVTASTTPADNDRLLAAFVVTDSGIGIEPDKLDMIFESFSQADSSITRRFGGSGLGLTISRKLVEAMGGTIQVKSIPGKGSSFSFAIPLLNSSTEPDGNSGVAAKPERTAAAEQSRLTGELKHVLLVDDSFENRELMRLLLRTLSLKLDEAVNGQEALDLFTTRRYDLVLMDIQMPIMDGYTATRMIREHEEHFGLRRTAIIALTAHAYESDIQRCLEAGCDDHIAKPFKKQTLLDSLARHLQWS